MSIKKNIFAPLALGLGATRRAAVLLLVMMLTATTAWATDKTLSGSESYTAQNGDVLTGSTSGTVTIANNATITLSDVTITGGIVCAGTAEITLVGTNSVTGFSRFDPNINAYRYTAGIQIGGSGTTLTINGDGSLTANGAQYAAGIGLNGAWNVTEDVIGGNIVINGGNITANGGVGAAGIGAGFTKDPHNSSERKAIVGNITIKGGTVTAVGVTAMGGNGADGIGAGDNIYNATYQIGTMTIYDDIDKVDASAITESVTYMHIDGNTETDVTANASTYFTITEDGNRRVIAPKDDTDYTITIANGIEHGTLEGAATAKYMEKVTITVTPALGYRFSRLVVKDAQNNDVALTNNTFLMPKSNVTVSAVFEQGVHGTTEFTWRYSTGPNPTDEVRETIYDGVTTVNIQETGQNVYTGTSYTIQKYEEYTNYKFRLDNNEDGQAIPFTGTGEFVQNQNPTAFYVTDYNELGFYDITMTDVGNGKWSVSILKTVAVMDAVPDQTYTGSAITPEPTVIAGSLNLTKGTDYTYSYENNTDAGTAKVIATFQGDYESLGSVEKEFKIVNVKQLSDGTAYTSTSDVSETTAIYTKSIGDERVGKYQAWFVPFDYTVTTDDLEKFDFFKINFIANAAEEGVNPEDDHVYIFLNPIAAGTTLYGNKPYVYRAKEAIDNYSFTTENTTLLAKNESSVLQTSTALANYDFYGTYDNVTATPSSPFYYISINGNVCYGTSVTVGPYRWILRATSKGGVSYAPQITFSEGETTAIDHSTFNVQRSTFNVYDLQGRKVANGQSSMVNGQLKKGLYIVNGRKVVIK